MRSFQSEATLDQNISRYFTLRQLCHCGETWQQFQPINLPNQLRSFNDLSALGRFILDPLHEEFGTIKLSYGFAGPELLRHIRQRDKPRIAPQLDQHAASELNQKGTLICPRAGAAVDLQCPDINSFELALWSAQHLPFDRIYIYSKDRPIHLSYHKNPNRQIVWVQRQSNRKVLPKKLNAQQLEALLETSKAISTKPSC